MKLNAFLKTEASKKLNTIVLPEAEYSQRILDAGIVAATKGFAKIIFVTKSALILPEHKNISQIIISKFDRLDEMQNLLYNLRKEKGITLENSKKLVTQNCIYFSTMLVHMGIADGMVAGAETATKDVLRPPFEIIKGRKGGKVSSVFILEPHKTKLFKNNGLLFMTDASIIIKPNVSDLIQITKNVAIFAKLFTDKLNVAFLSHSTKNSGTGESVDLINEVVNELDTKPQDFIYDGPFQGDAALRASVAFNKAKNSLIKGNANILVFPDITSGNIAVKLFQIANGCESLGPISVGFNKPVNDVSRGASVNEIVLSICLTSMQCNK